MSSNKRRRVRRAIGAVAVTATVIALVTPSTPAFAVSGSTFEETDGNMVVDGGAATKDWASFATPINCTAPFADCAVDKPTGQGDDSFGQGSKDDHTTLQVVSGSIPNNKSDLARLYVASERLDVPNDSKDHDFVYFGWVRNNTLGTANFSIELNQVASSAVPAAGSSYTIDRKAGDRLFLYDFAQGGKADSFALRMSTWVVSGSPKTACQASSTVPCWGKAVDIKKAGFANGSINKAGITDVLFPEPSGGTPLPQLTFGELAVDLTAAGVTSVCPGFGSAMIRSRASSAFNAELKDFIAPAAVSVGGGGTDTTGWRSHGTALTDRVFDSALHPEKTYGTSAKSDTNTANPDSQTNSVGSIDVPPSDVEDTPKGSILHADLLTSSATSSLSAERTEQTSIARVAGVNVLDGTVTASVIEATGLTSADGDGATPSTGFSGLKDLKVDLDGAGGNPPVAMNNVAPNTRIELSPAAFGPGSYVEIRRQHLSTTYPAPGTPLRTQVNYGADVNEISMLHVHVTDRTPDVLPDTLPNGEPNPLADGDVTTDIVLASATAHSASSGVLCQAAQAVEGHATVLRGNVGNLLGASIGNAALPSGGGGGADHQGLESLSLGDPAVVTAGVSTSDTQGAWGDTSSHAQSQAKVAGLCVHLDAVPGCDIAADALESHVSSDGSATSWSSTGGASFVNLVVMGNAVSVPPGTVQEIPGVGRLVIGELVCGDGSTPSTSTCSTTGPSSAMTVRALHILVTEPLPQPNALGLTLGSEIVIAESYSGATFVAVS